jgi:hypothetical protein
MKELTKTIRCAWVVALVHAASITQPAMAASSVQELIAEAPVMVIGLDNSGSSPALSESVLGSAWPEISHHVKGLPLGSTVKVFTVGDARSPTVSPLPLRIQKKVTENGGPHEHVLGELKKIILGFPEQVRKGNIKEHGRSELIGGFDDASKLINRKSKENVIFFISDLIENSNHANCYKDVKCRLPAPTFSLAGARVMVIGVGAGRSAKESMVIAGSWNGFLSKTQAVVTINDLRRIN